MTTYHNHKHHNNLVTHRLTQEISELQIHLSKLNTKLSEAENAMKMLKNTKRELKDDLNVKALSLVIDRYGETVWNIINTEILLSPDRSVWPSD